MWGGRLYAFICISLNYIYVYVFVCGYDILSACTHTGQKYQILLDQEEFQVVVGCQS